MLETHVHVIDYGLGNLGSIINMFRRIGVSAQLTSDIDEIMRAERILLPGVGSFDQGMTNLHKRNLIPVLNQKVLEEKIPVLGICLGMQLMTESSQEGKMPGLGWIKGSTLDMRPFVTSGENVKFPHVGWNYIDSMKDHFLLSGLPEDPRFYFVHSYMVSCDDKADVLSTTNYHDIDITAMFVRDNVAGAQCHPEKSHKFGMQIFRNFAKWMP